MHEIAAAQSADPIQIIGNLFREYEQFLQVDLCFQQFEEELAGLPDFSVSRQLDAYGFHSDYRPVMDGMPESPRSSSWQMRP